MGARCDRRCRRIYDIEEEVNGAIEDLGCIKPWAGPIAGRLTYCCEVYTPRYTTRRARREVKTSGTRKHCQDASRRPGSMVERAVCRPYMAVQTQSSSAVRYTTTRIGVCRESAITTRVCATRVPVLLVSSARSSPPSSSSPCFLHDQNTVRDVLHLDSELG